MAAAEEELAALSAIFGPSLSTSGSGVEVSLGELRLCFQTRPLGPVLQLRGRDARSAWALEAQRAAQALMEASVRDGEPAVLFGAIESVREAMERERWQQPAAAQGSEVAEGELVGSMEDAVAESFEWQEILESQNEDIHSAHSSLNIQSGVPMIVKKSVFVAHCCRVESVAEAMSFRSFIMNDRRCASATHNIFAFRVLGSGSNAIVFQDCDDDGETAAGGRLGELLRLLPVTNVAVVVSRWFGGVLLGPERFKHINNVARDLLVHCGFVGSTDGSQNLRSRSTTVAKHTKIRNKR
jgi:hypothetical protein